MTNTTEEDTMSTTLASVHYRKTKDGKWVVAGPSQIIRAGALVTVTKRSGETKQEHVESVGREYDDAGVKCRYGYIAQRSSNRHARRGVARCERCRDCGGNGSVERELGACEACGADFDC